MQSVLLYLVMQGKSTTTAVPTTVGTKRKAASISELKEWTCALCHVHATSERGLKEHFRGKKHRAKEEELKGSKGVKSQPAPIPEKIVGQPKIVKKVANSAQNQNQKQTKKPSVVNQPADQSVPKNEVMAPKKGKFTFVCQQCKIKCYNEPTMVAHLSGKKHLTRVKELETISEGLTANVTSFKITGKGDGVAGGLGKELKIERESRRTVDEEAEVAEALTDEEGQEIEEQMDDDIEPVDELEEEASFFKLHMRGEQY